MRAHCPPACCASKREAQNKAQGCQCDVPCESVRSIMCSMMRTRGCDGKVSMFTDHACTCQALCVASQLVLELVRMGYG